MKKEKRIDLFKFLARYWILTVGMLILLFVNDINSVINGFLGINLNFGAVAVVFIFFGILFAFTSD